MESQASTPERILMIAFGFTASQYLFVACKFNLFTYLHKNPDSSSEQIKDALSLNGKGLLDYLDALVALNILKRKGLKSSALYSNSVEAENFLVEGVEGNLLGIVKRLHSRIYSLYGSFDEALITGEKQSTKLGNYFDFLYANDEDRKAFLKGMGSVQTSNMKSLAKQFDFSKYASLTDIGGALGNLSIEIAKAHEHINCTSWDLPQVQPLANEFINEQGLSERIKTVAGDFFKDDFPKSDIITMGNILHDWGLETKKMLLKKAYDALPENGAFIAIEEIFDSDRNNFKGLTMSLLMLILTGEGFDYSEDDFREWVTEVGFKKVEFLKLAHSKAGIAYK